MLVFTVPWGRHSGEQQKGRTSRLTAGLLRPLAALTSVRDSLAPALPSRGGPAFGPSLTYSAPCFCLCLLSADKFPCPSPYLSKPFNMATAGTSPRLLEASRSIATPGSVLSWLGPAYEGNSEKQEAVAWGGEGGWVERQALTLLVITLGASQVHSTFL